MNNRNGIAVSIGSDSIMILYIHINFHSVETLIQTIVFKMNSIFSLIPLWLF